MLRICLIIAIVAGLAAAVVSFVKVREIMVQTMTERDTFHQERDQEKSEKQKAQGELKKTKGELDATKSTLASTEAKLKTTTAKAVELEKQKTELTSTLNHTREERDTAQQKLSQWDQVGATPDQVKGIIADLKKTTTERNVYIAENKTLLGTITKLNNELDKYRDPNAAVPLPAGLKGTVVAVDPKFDFVVLDIGENKGVLERGEMMINRNGKLIGKVRIASVNKDRSIANVMPSWKQGEVMEGDQVLY